MKTPLISLPFSLTAIFGATLWAIVATVMAVGAAAGADKSDRVDFKTQIEPIFTKYCLECHGEENEEAFRIDVDNDMMLYVIEGDPENSDLYTVMTLDEDDDLLMPPIDHQPRPEPAEIQLVSTWIAQGANLTPVQFDNSQADDSETDKEELANAVSPERQRIYNALGSLHTAAVHLPIGLLLAAGLFGLLSLGGSFVMSDCAYYCLWLGTLGAIFATASGWYYSPMEHRGTVNDVADLLDQTHPVYWHRLGAIISTVVALLLCLFAKGARGRNPDDGMMWKLGAIALAAGIGWVGHTGGELTYGKDHYKDLNELVQSIMAPEKEAMIDDAGDADAESQTDRAADEMQDDDTDPTADSPQDI